MTTGRSYSVSVLAYVVGVWGRRRGFNTASTMPSGSI
jgi:hypothetical protein